VADTRIHGTTKRHVGRVFREVEQATLLPLPPERFPFFHEAERSVNRDGHIEVAKANYSVPPEYLGHKLWTRWDHRLVRVFNQRLEQIAFHVRQAPGMFSTLGEHLLAEKISNAERGAEWMLRKVRSIGEPAHTWAQKMLENRGIKGLRVLQGLLALPTKHSCEAVNEACRVAISYGAFRLKTLRELLRRGAPLRSSLPYLDEHPLIRPMSDYGDWLHDAFGRFQGEEPAGPPGSSPRRPPSSPLLWFRLNLACFPENFTMKDPLQSTLRQLRLSGLAQTLEVRLHEAASRQFSHAEFLELILQDELCVRDERRIQRRVKAATFRELKPLDEFEWSFNPSLPKKQIFDLATCRFIRERRDALLIGGPLGTGKSYRLRRQTADGSAASDASNAAIAPTGSDMADAMPSHDSPRKNRKNEPHTACQSQQLRGLSIQASLVFNAPMIGCI
jgi:hypothetical protein